MKIAKIDALIHIIRGHRVMLDRDLAELYGVMTGELNQAVKRQANRFPHGTTRSTPLSPKSVILRRRRPLSSVAEPQFFNPAGVFGCRRIALAGVAQSPHATSLVSVQFGLVLMAELHQDCIDIGRERSRKPVERAPGSRQ